MGKKISLGHVAWAASQAKDHATLIALPVRNLTIDQAMSWPLCGIVEREPSKTSLWRLTEFGFAVRNYIKARI